MQPLFSGFSRNAEMSTMEPNQLSSQATLRRSNQTSQSDFSLLDSMQDSQPFPCRIGVQITPKWDDMNELTKYTAAKHQTLFAMDTSGQAIIGTPNNPDEIKRVCASITSYMKPRFVIQLMDQNGQPLKLSLQTRTTIVNATTGESDEGTCDHCKQVAPSKRPIVYQWRSGRNKLFSEILGQTDEQGRQVLDIKIGCLTGTGLSRQQKGHKHDFMIRTEVLQYPGVSGYSVAIQMGSKYIDCSQKHTKKKLEREVEQTKTKKVTQKQNSPQETGGNSLLPMQISQTSNSMLPQFGENNIQKHGIVLPPLANITEVGKKPNIREENQNNTTSTIALPVKETLPWNQEKKKIEPVERIGAAILPPIKTISQFEQGSEAFNNRQVLPPVRMSQEEMVIPPLEVILSSISQDHGNNWQDSHHRSPMLELAENFMEAASSMEQSISEQGNSTGHHSLNERQLKKQRLRQELFNSDHSFRSYSSIFEGRPLSPMNEITSSMPPFESRSSPSIEGILGCSTNALTMEQRAEIWQFLCGNRTNPGMDPLRYIILNQEPSIWNAHSHHSSVIPVEQTILELNYETGRWSTYKNQGKYHLA